MAEQENAKKKFKVRKWMVFAAAGLAAVLIAFLIMGFIPHRAFTRDEFSDFLFVRVFDHQGNNFATIRNSATNDDLSEAEKEHEKGQSSATR